jgi:hypothetical protein
VAPDVRPSGEAVSQRCADCRHSRLWPNGLLFCHRYPRTFDGYPEVSPNDDCGEWVEGEAKAGIAVVMDEREAARQETDEWAHNVLHALDLPLHRSVEEAVEAIEDITTRMNAARKDAARLRTELQAARRYLRDVLRDEPGAAMAATAYLNDKEKTP